VRYQVVIGAVLAAFILGFSAPFGVSARDEFRAAASASPAAVPLGVPYCDALEPAALQGLYDPLNGEWALQDVALEHGYSPYNPAVRAYISAYGPALGSVFLIRNGLYGTPPPWDERHLPFCNFLHVAWENETGSAHVRATLERRDEILIALWCTRLRMERGDAAETFNPYLFVLAWYYANWEGVFTLFYGLARPVMGDSVAQGYAEMARMASNDILRNLEASQCNF
jgi:hypothetical protein